MYSIDQLAEIVDKSLREEAFPEEPHNLYAPIRYALSSGGKRLRPVFALAACNAFSPFVEAAIYPALAIELFHNFTLVHDDIMDNAAVRRSQPTVYAKWGPNVAILSGDAMNILAYQLLGRTNPENLPRVMHTFNNVALRVCEGQQMDMDFERAPCVTLEEYLKMIELKTAILLKGALEIGAIVGHANSSDIEKIGEFGRTLGVAFQIQDDLLDTYGNAHIFGKRIGGDIVANKKTFLTAKGFSLATGKQRELLHGYFKAENMAPEKKIEGVTKIYNELGIKDLTEQKIEEYFKLATEALEKVNLKGENKQTLLCLAAKIMARKN